MTKTSVFFYKDHET
uniref:Uncharacterized protein n=1 Tax=Anopheles funestus TaxID=62324 RepID=A0A4Y0BGB6_ANOFN